MADVLPSKTSPWLSNGFLITKRLIVMILLVLRTLCWYLRMLVQWLGRRIRVNQILTLNAAPPPLPPPGPLCGYDYVPFEALDMPRTLKGHIHTSPTLHDALAAMDDLQLIIQPKCKTGARYKDPDLDLWTQVWLEGMQSVLHMYTDYKSRTYNQWGASMYQVAIGMGWGCNCIWWLQELLWGYLADRKVLPVNPYRDWNKSLLVDKNLCNEISIYLMSIGNEISAKRLMEFLHKPDIKEKYGIEKNISLWTACQYLNTLGY
jgi:hypothetical protein